MKKLISNVFVTLALTSVSIGLSGCKKNVDSNKLGEIWVMTWNGDGEHYKDIGHKNFSSDDLTTSSVALMYALAKSYNENIDDTLKINLASYQYEGDTLAAGGLTWSQKRENFKSKYGKYPDIFLSTSLFDDATLGLTADLSVFEDDEAYQELDPTLKKMMNYFGLQAGLPQYAIPAGVFVNKELALSQGISIPNPLTWTWEDYTNFTANETIISLAKSGQMAGAMNAGMEILKSAYIVQQIADGNWEVDFTSMGFREFLGQLPKQASSSAYGNAMVGDRWSWAPFRDGEVLTTIMDPWMIQSAGAQGDSAIKSGSFDIFPRPSLVYHKGQADEEIIDNHVSAATDPVAIYNHCRNDGKATCNEEETAKINESWNFLKYWLTDTRSWQARAAQQYKSSTDAQAVSYYKSALSESLPVTTGAKFEEQLEIWYSDPNIAVLKDTEKFPGFTEVLKLWRAGKIYGGSDKAIPRFYTLPGDATRHDILDVLAHYGNESMIQINIQDPTWKDTYYLYLTENQAAVNTRYKNAYNSIRTALKEKYGWTEVQLPPKK